MIGTVRVSGGRSTPIGYRQGVLTVEELSVPEIIETASTPTYIYSTLAIETRYREFQETLDGVSEDLCYALKANSALGIVSAFAALGAGADVVSEGELLRALAAGIPANRIVFSGVGKSDQALKTAIQTGILQINVESFPELERLAQIAQTVGRKVDIGIRLNLDIDAQTHSKISTGRRQDKFGIAHDLLLPVLEATKEMAFIVPRGLAIHIGSQITTPEPYQEAFSRLSAIAAWLETQGYPIDRLDLGGGLGIPREDSDLSLQEYARIIQTAIDYKKYRLILEPGRALIGSAGILIARILYVKEQYGTRFLILDAAMNDFIRPCLYQAYHPIVPVRAVESTAPIAAVEVVGCVCESGDTFASARPMPRLKAGDLVAFLECGAYGASMASEYNARPRVSEIMIKQRQTALIRPTPSHDALLKQEIIPAWL